MAYRAYNKNKSRSFSGTHTYVSGSTVKNLAASPDRLEIPERTRVPGRKVSRPSVQERPVRRELTEEERVEERRKQSRIHRANKMNFLYTVGVSAIVITIFTICWQYLNMQSVVKANASEVTQLQSELNELTNSNDELELEINAGIDYEAIYNTAVNELGMVYPEREQVITYDAGVSEYVKQYHDIP